MPCTRAGVLLCLGRTCPCPVWVAINLHNASNALSSFSLVSIFSARAIGKEMPHAGVYVLASLISSVSAALILASGPSYIEPRSPQGTVYDANPGQSTYDGCRTSPCQIVYRMHFLLTLLCFMVAEYVHDLSASKFCGGLLLMGALTTGSSYQEHGGQYALSPKGS